MKCAVCGKEFGSGINCQNCGVDRVTALANYSGYVNHAGNSHYNPSNKTEYVPNRTTVCYACGEIIPSNAEYCPYCRKKLYENCPKCGKEYSSQFKYCPKCGTNIDQYIEEYIEELEEAEREEEIRVNADRLAKELWGKDRNLICILMIICVIFGFLDWYLDWYPWNVMFGVLIEFIVMIAYIAVVEYRIKKWKREHPNDPRNKYLKITK